MEKIPCPGEFCLEKRCIFWIKYSHLELEGPFWRPGKLLEICCFCFLVVGNGWDFSFTSCWFVIGLTERHNSEMVLPSLLFWGCYLESSKLVEYQACCQIVVFILELTRDNLSHEKKLAIERKSLRVFKKNIRQMLWNNQVLEFESTLPPIFMEAEVGPCKMSLVSMGSIFHFHDRWKKSNPTS